MEVIELSESEEIEFIDQSDSDEFEKSGLRNCPYLSSASKTGRKKNFRVQRIAFFF